MSWKSLNFIHLPFFNIGIRQTDYNHHKAWSCTWTYPSEKFLAYSTANLLLSLSRLAFTPHSLVLHVRSNGVCWTSEQCKGSSYALDIRFVYSTHEYGKASIHIATLAIELLYPVTSVQAPGWLRCMRALGLRTDGRIKMLKKLDCTKNEISARYHRQYHPAMSANGSQWPSGTSNLSFEAQFDGHNDAFITQQSYAAYGIVKNSFGIRSRNDADEDVQ